MAFLLETITFMISEMNIVTSEKLISKIKIFTSKNCISDM